MAESLGTYDASPKPGIPGLTITLSAEGESDLVVKLVERWPNALKLNIAYLNVDNVFGILDILVSPDEVDPEPGFVLEEGKRMRTHQEMFRNWYIRTDADDRALVYAIDAACRRLNNGRPLASVAPLLALSLHPEVDGSDDSDANTPDSPSTTPTGEPSSTASTKPSGETPSNDSSQNDSEINLTPLYTLPMSISK